MGKENGNQQESKSNFQLVILHEHIPLYDLLGDFMKKAGYGSYLMIKEPHQDFRPEKYTTFTCIGTGERFFLEQQAEKLIPRWDKISKKQKGSERVDVPSEIRHAKTNKPHEETLTLPNVRLNHR